MASLMEELIGTLSEEYELYRQVLPIAERKTEIIVRNNLEELQKVTAKEQEAVEKVNSLEKKREKVLKNIAVVLNLNPKELKIVDIIKLLDKQPDEQRRLSQIHDNLKTTITRLVEVNNHNKSLVEQSLEFIEFNMNFIQSTRTSPGNNNYTKGAAPQILRMFSQAFLMRNNRKVG